MILVLLAEDLPGILIILYKLAGSIYLSHNRCMKIKTHDEALVNPAVVAEIQALYMEIEKQQKTINDLVIVVNSLVEWKKLSHPSPIE
jgi:hypothetical protein